MPIPQPNDGIGHLTLTGGHRRRFNSPSVVSPPCPPTGCATYSVHQLAKDVTAKSELTPLRADKLNGVRGKGGWLSPLVPFYRFLHRLLTINCD